MPPVHSFSRLFAMRSDWPVSKLPVALGWTQEIEYPFRRGRCIIWRLPRTQQTYATGVWLTTVDEVEALTKALSA
jgi:hypothetical protein